MKTRWLKDVGTLCHDTFCLIFGCIITAYCKIICLFSGFVMLTLAAEKSNWAAAEVYLLSHSHTQNTGVWNKVETLQGGRECTFDLL